MALVLATLMAVVGPVSAAAVVPGTNGPIAFTSFRDGNGEVYVMNAASNTVVFTSYAGAL